MIRNEDNSSTAPPVCVWIEQEANNDSPGLAEDPCNIKQEPASNLTDDEFIGHNDDDNTTNEPPYVSFIIHWLMFSLALFVGKEGEGVGLVGGNAPPLPLQEGGGSKIERKIGENRKWPNNKMFNGQSSSPYRPFPTPTRAKLFPYISYNLYTFFFYKLN